MGKNKFIIKTVQKYSASFFLLALILQINIIKDKASYLYYLDYLNISNKWRGKN